EIHRVDPAAEERKTAELQEFKRRRDRSLVDERLAELSEEAAGDANLMQATIEAVRARATGGEIVEGGRAGYGSYVAHAVFCARGRSASCSARSASTATTAA